MAAAVKNVFQEHFQPNAAADKRRRLPHARGCLWTASVDFAKFIALHAGTLNRSVWDPRFSKVRAAGCKRHRLIGAWYTSNHLGVCSENLAVSHEHHQLSLLAVSSTTLSGVSCLWRQHGG